MLRYRRIFQLPVIPSQMGEMADKDAFRLIRQGDDRIVQGGRCDIRQGQTQRLDRVFRQDALHHDMPSPFRTQINNLLTSNECL